MTEINFEEMSFINFLIYTLSVVPFITFASLIISSLIVINTDKKKEKLEEEEEEEEEIYTDKYNTSGYVDEYINNLDNICLMENTPNGLVLMKYNNDDSVWEYWADKKYKNNISYSELDTVARKFCQTYKCNDLYIDRKEELEKQKEELEKQKEELEKQKEELEKQDDDSEKQDDDDLFIKSKKIENTNDKSVSVPKKANSYRYKGNINEIELFKKEEKKTDVVETSWSSWKNMLN